MDVMEVIRTRRSTRSFQPRSLDAQAMEAIETAILNSPSGSNAQESHFVIVKDPDQIRRIKRFAPGLSGQPAAVVVLCSNRREALIRGGTDTVQTLRFVNLGIAAAYILLVTSSLQLGNCPVRSFHKKAVQTLLQLPEDVEPELLITVGHPAEPPRPKVSKPVTEVISYDRFGTR
ncbi:nitroreductase family protein [Alicyclobacillus macrosporangiidus]|uniref:Nitroreductase n=1 Tax=Alicyclobacillus macrosporangiidus TaxID=392015 RepID=A0A1I7LHX3_9BACL|nr:nitroreductase family protein [Alicyclobacillus macrosporangiidus]SFV09267.1 Nitroreductase [Alicyclobacillus macrosporangiidus]